MHKWGGNNTFPLVVSIFSAPNYCGTYKNKGAVMIIRNNNIQLEQIISAEAPYDLPDGLNLFSWSLPFVLEKVQSMLNHIIQ